VAGGAQAVAEGAGAVGAAGERQDSPGRGGGWEGGGGILPCPVCVFYHGWDDSSRSFFDEVGLISHQINSYNEFVSHGLQEHFDSLGEVIVEPGYDPSKKGSVVWKHAIIKFGRVKLEKPVFWTGKDEGSVDFKPWHARLQNMTYASRLIVEVNIQVLTIFILLHAHYLFFIYAMVFPRRRATWVNYKISDEEKKFTKMLEYE
jgi:hypothetical protein